MYREELTSICDNWDWLLTIKKLYSWNLEGLMVDNWSDGRDKDEDE